MRKTKGKQIVEKEDAGIRKLRDKRLYSLKAVVARKKCMVMKGLQEEGHETPIKERSKRMREEMWGYNWKKIKGGHAKMEWVTRCQSLRCPRGGFKERK